VLVIHGGSASSRIYGDTWVRNAQGWELATAPTAQPLRIAAYGSTYDPGSKSVIIFGGTVSDNEIHTQNTYAFRLRGGSCKTPADCSNGFCTDGVCCERATCGTCETCAGENPGVCGPVRSEEDPDSCGSAEKKGCNARAVCTAGRGATCQKDADCAEGICSDGLCCNERCAGACQSCKASEKISGPDGICGVAKIGGNPRKACGESAQCNSSGVCASGATCVDATTLQNSTGEKINCAPYACRGQACLPRCNNVDDCVFPSTCSASGKCEVPVNSEESGCAMAGSGSSESLALLLAVFALLPRRRAATVHSTTVRSPA
jgi:hypothetical protein